MIEPDSLADLRAPAPCDHCSIRARCACGEACRAFAAYVHGDNAASWRLESREPDRATFRAVFTKVDPPNVREPEKPAPRPRKVRSQPVKLARAPRGRQPAQVAA